MISRLILLSWPTNVLSWPTKRAVLLINAHIVKYSYRSRRAFCHIILAMLKLRSTLSVMFAILAAASCAKADVILVATLTNAAENPPTTPTTSGGAPRTSFGFATFDLNNAMTAMTFTATITGIDITGTQSADPNDNLIAAHIHASPTVTPTTNAGVVWGFFGNPFNDNNPNDVVITPFATGVGFTISGKWDAPEGNGTTLAAQLPNILNGHVRKLCPPFKALTQHPCHEVQSRGRFLLPRRITPPKTGFLGIGPFRLLVWRCEVASN